MTSSRYQALRYATATLVLVALTLLYHATSKSVILWTGEQAHQLRTHARTMQALLREQGIGLKPHDQALPALDAPIRAAAGKSGDFKLERAQPVLLEVQQGAEWVFAPVMPPQNLLLQQGLSVFPGDRIAVDGLPQLGPGTAESSAGAYIRLRSGRRIEILIDGRSHILFSSAPTLGEALWENGIELFEGDALTPGPETDLAEIVTAQLVRSVPLTITASGFEQRIRTSAATVGEALEQAGLSLQGLDYALPDEQGPLPTDGRVQVVRVEEQIEVVLEPLPFETAYQAMPEAEIDTQRILQAGTYGVQASRQRLRLEDGVEIGRTGQGEWVAKEPSDQIVGYGTQIVIRTLDTPDGPIDYWRAVQMYATSYSPSRAGVPEDSPWFGITASGKAATKGLVAIDRSLIPFGTMMYVPGYGFAEAADTGGGVKGRWIDLGYDDDNYVPWHQYVTVYFVAPAPPAGSIVWIFP